MHITTPTRIAHADRVRIAADVVWEDRERPGVTLYYDVRAEHASLLAPRAAEAFLLATAVIAQHEGERRISVDDDLCPLLAERLQGAMRLLRQWHGVPPACRIEARRWHPLTPASPGQAGMFLSGGVDSLFTLLHNHDRFPTGHPRRYTQGLLVYGLDLGVPGEPPTTALFDDYIARLAPVADDLDLNLVTVWTNARAIDGSKGLYDRFHFGALLASIAHVLSGTLVRVGVSSDNVWESLGHRGSHPLLMANYTSSALDCDYEGASISRLEKVRRLAQAAAVMRVMRVCYHPKRIDEGNINCGTCRKCVITLLEIIAAGATDRAASFADPRVTPDRVAEAVVDSPTLFEYYEELVEPLTAAGRSDLAEAIRRKLRAGRRVVRWRRRVDALRTFFRGGS